MAQKRSGSKERSQKRILVVDDEVSVRLAIETVLRKGGYRYSSAQTAGEAKELITNPNNEYDMVITDWRMEHKHAGLEVIKTVAARNLDIPVLVITAYANVEGAVAAMKYGAYDYIEKPFSIDELEATIEAALHRPRPRTLPPETSESASAEPFEGIIGEDPEIMKIFDIVRTISDVDATTLLTGETGTGKELFARSIHRTSQRSGKSFVAVNCGAIPENLIESELFGHKKGSFTDAKADRPGHFQIADGGTIFLDEIGDMPLSMQVKLLRVLQEKEIKPIGETAKTPIDVRVIAATHHDLEAAVAKGAFREDLYWRLNVIHIEIPPLRRRSTDILRLVSHFVRHFNKVDRRAIEGISPAVQKALMSYAWPGNIRELENTIERIVILKRKGIVELRDLPAKIMRGGPASRPVVQAVVAASTPISAPMMIYGTGEMEALNVAEPPSADEDSGVQPPPAPPMARPVAGKRLPTIASADLELLLPPSGINLKTFIQKMEDDLIDQAVERSNGVIKRAADLLKMNRTTLVERLRKRERRNS